MPQKEEEVFEKKPFISRVAGFFMAATVVTVSSAQVKPALASSPTPSSSLITRKASSAEQQQASTTMAKHRQAFVENKGQWTPSAKFLFHRAGMDVWVTNTGWRINAFRNDKNKRVGHIFAFDFLGSRPSKVSGSGPDNMIWDYMGHFGGTGTHHKASGYREVTAANLYPGVDAVYKIDQGSPRFDLHVKPHVDPSVIALGIKGSQGIAVGSRGNLEVKTSIGALNFGGLKAYQILKGNKKVVPASFVVSNSGKVGFKLGAYDRSKELVIDPIIYGTYFGGDGGWDEVHACVTDTSQGTYITGSTQEDAFPANYGPYSLNINGPQDAFIAKLQGDVYNRDYAAIFGGSGSDQGDYIQVDRQGNVWIAGLSDSLDFPGAQNDCYVVVKADTTATGGTVQFSVNGTRGPLQFTLPYNFSASQLQAKLASAYPSATVTLRGNNFDIYVPYPDRLSININSFDTWARLINTPLAANVYFLQGGKPTAASGGTFTLSGIRSNGSSFTTAPIPYNVTLNQLANIINGSSGTPWTLGFDPLVPQGTTPAFPANGIIIAAPSGYAITGIDQSKLTGGTIYLGQFGIDSFTTDKAHSVVTGGAFTVNANGLTVQFAWQNPGDTGQTLNLKATTLQTDLSGALAGLNLRYALVLPSNSSTPAGGSLVVYGVTEGATTTAPIPPATIRFLPSTANGGPYTLTPTPNYYSNTANNEYHKFGFLMRWKKDSNSVLNPEVGSEKVATWICQDANATINGFNIYKISDTPSNENVPFLIAGTNFDKSAGPSPVKFTMKNPSGRISSFINGYSPASYSYRLRFQFNPNTNTFIPLNTPNGGVAQSGYDGDSSSAPVIVRGSVVDSFGNQVIAGTVHYASNIDTRNPGSPFVTTSNAYNQGGFDGRLLRGWDIFVRKYDVNGKLTSSCLIGGNSDDEAGGYDRPKEMLLPDNLSPGVSNPAGSTFHFQETITGSCVAVDNLNNIYVTGISRSFNFPRTRGVFGEQFDQFAHVTVTKLAPDCSSLLYSTHLNSANFVLPGGIAVGPGGEAYVTGNIHPWSVDFPHPGNTDDWGNAPSGTGDSAIVVTPDALRPAYTKTNTPDIPGADGWVTVLNSTATGLIYSSYLGGDLDDQIFQPYVDKFGDCWISGWTSSRRDIYVWPSHTATSGTRYLVDAPLSGGQITSLAFKANTDLTTQLETGIAYGILDTRNGAQLPLTFPPTDGFYPGYYSEARDGLVQRYRFNLPVLQGVSFDRPTLAGGLGNVSTGTVVLSQAAPAPGLNITLSMTNNSAASFSQAGPVFQTVITIPTGATTGTFQVFTNPVATSTAVDISAAFEGDVKVGRIVVAPWFSSLSITPNSVVGGQPVQGRVRLFENAPAGGVPVSLVSSDPTLAKVPSTLTVPAGQPEGAFTITTSGVNVSSIVQISASFSGYGGQQQLTLTPANLFTLTFDPTIVDAKSTATGTIKLDGLAGKKFTVSPVPGSLPPGFSVSPNPIVFDPADTTQDASSRTFTLNTPFLANDVTLSVTFQRNDNPSQKLVGSIQVLADPITGISIDTPQVVGGSASSVTVSISSPAAKGGAYVHVTSGNAAATITGANGLSGTSVLCLIPEGQTTASFPVKTSVVLSDTVVQFTADRGTASSGVPGGIVKTAPVPLTIKGIGVTLTLSPTSVSGGISSTGTVVLSHVAPSGGLSVALKSSDTTIAKVPATVTVAAGSTKGVFTVTTAQPASGTTKTATITATLGSSSSSQDLTVQAPHPVSIGFNPNPVTGGNATVGTITLDAAAPSNGAAVALTSSDNSIAILPAKVTVPAGKKSVTFNVTTKSVLGQKSAVVTATFNGVSVQTTLNVVSAHIATVSLSPSTVTGGQTSQCTVTLNTGAPVGGATVTLQNSNGTIATVPASVFIPAGQSSVTFNVTTQPVSRSLSVTITASYNSTQGAGSLTITP